MLYCCFAADADVDAAERAATRRRDTRHAIR